MKICVVCKVEKPDNQYYPRRNRVGGNLYVTVQSRCKACTAKVIGAYRQNQRLKASRAG